MATASRDSEKYRAIDLRGITGVPQWAALDEDLRQAVEVVGHVLPFRTNQYVLDNLIDWSRVPNDPIFQLVFPQRSMLEPDDFDVVRTMLERADSPEALQKEVNRVRPVS